MAERRLHGLQRVLGVNALFSTAYGNVGSSIYYALGLVASFALVLTPVVFGMPGFIFYLTATTYPEATAMYPYTGSETIANRAEEAKDESKTIPEAIKRVVIAVFAIYALLPAVALSALPVTCNAGGHCQTLLGLTEEQGGYAGDPVLGVV